MKFIDLCGKTFGKWTVLSRYHDEKVKRGKFLCKCECGTEKVVVGHTLTSGKSTNCGCERNHKTMNLTHGHTSGGASPEYRSWAGMLTRCTNPKSIGYNNYGGRGITVCDRWKVFDNFLEDMGCKPSNKHSIDRIDVNKGYSPDNCRWATYKEQAWNRRIKKTNKSGITGVYKTPENKWRVMIGSKSLGLFSDFEEARNIRMRAEIDRLNNETT